MDILIAIVLFVAAMIFIPGVYRVTVTVITVLYAIFKIVVFAGNAGAQQTAGFAYVIDGDTLSIGHKRIRLHGIDAPELHQVCDGVPMGLFSRKYLDSLVDGHVVACDFVVRDKYGRDVSTCLSHDGKDLSKEQVRAGMAFAFIRYSVRYAGYEDKARDENLGVHKYHCEHPWAWRTKNPAQY